MPITASSRVCTGCHRLLPEPPAPAVCAKCGRVAAPLHGDWPKGLKRWLVAQLLEQFFAPWAESTHQYRWERLLVAVIAGRRWGTRIIPYATSPEDCFAVALQHCPAVAPERPAHTEAA